MSIIKRKAGSQDIVKSVLEFDETPTDGSPNLVESGAVAEAIAAGRKIAVFEVNLGYGVQYPTFNDIRQAVDSGKVPVLHIVNYNGTSDSPADYFYIVNYNSAPNYHSYSFSNGSLVKIVNSSNEWSDTGASRYTTRTETATTLPATINVNDCESLLYNVNGVPTNTQIYTIKAPAGTTDAQVAIISQSDFFTSFKVMVNESEIPLFDLRIYGVSLNIRHNYSIVESLNEGACGVEPPTSFDEMGLADEVVTDVSTDYDTKVRLHTYKVLVKIVGQVAYILSER